MRIALAQINPIVGDIAANVEKILSFTAQARQQHAELVVFPELAIVGYPPKDLLLKPGFVDDNLAALDHLAREISGIDVLVGYAQRNTNPVGRDLWNAVALIRDGKVVSRHYKTLLPTYDVFDESRYFEPGPANERNQLVSIGDPAIPVGISICEDLWNDEHLIPRRLYHQNPIEDLHTAGAKVLINSSASPYVVGKHEFRLKLFGEQARRFAKPLIFVNQVGGNDELIFDGNSTAFDNQGNPIAQAKDFEEDLLVVELPPRDTHLPAVRVAPQLPPRDTGFQPVRGAQQGQDPHVTKNVPSTGIESIYKALLLGLKDYVRKCGFKSVVLGLSGGIDSALTATLAVDALGKDKVVGIAMPSRFSSDHSVNDARALAQNLGIEFHVIPIKDIHDAYEHTLAPAFKGLAPDVTEENLQARVRGALLMAFSNKFNHLLLTTGNKSELAVGYCTLYGDMCGGLAVISDVPKTTIWELSRWINHRAGREIIPKSSIDKVPSAELRPNQTDQDSLPPYDVLDAILHRYVEEEKGAAQIIAEGFDASTVQRVIKLIDRSEYKRRQAAPGLKVTSRAFGFGRRMPIAQNYTPFKPKYGEPAPQEK
jgi:NAD+ synthase (glutamine-hydrolysing)